MPYIETVDELTESIADYSNVYGNNGCTCEDMDENGDHLGDHEDGCTCRICFVSEIRTRIFSAMAYDAGVDKLST